MFGKPDDAYFKKLGRLLARKRKNKRQTQAGLAAVLKRPQSYVSKIETGERRLDLFGYFEFCQALGMRPARFLAEVEREVLR
jgi:transcriptional regulator with XRE-family HTH domain